MTTATAAPVNEVHLVGRVSGEPTARTLPSGDELVQLRVVVPRPGRRGDGARAQVDTIDVACWGARVRRTAARLPDGQGVEVTGSLRRRFFATATGRASRYEVEATSVRRVDLG
jgi:single-strand DNA-binding protein